MSEKLLKRIVGVFGYFVSVIIYLVIRFQDIDKTELRLLVDNWQVFLVLFMMVTLCSYFIYEK